MEAPNANASKLHLRTNPVLLLGMPHRRLFASLMAVLLLAGVFLKLRMFQYLGQQGMKRPVNVIILANQVTNSGKLHVHSTFFNY